jgi:hypothetical protein
MAGRKGEVEAVTKAAVEADTSKRLGGAAPGVTATSFTCRGERVRSFCSKCIL